MSGYEAVFGSEIRGLKLEKAWFTFYIKSDDGLELPLIIDLFNNPVGYPDKVRYGLGPYQVLQNVPHFVVFSGSGPNYVWLGKLEVSKQLY